MNLQEISKLQDKIEDFNESLLDAKELLIQKKPVTPKIYSDLKCKSKILIFEVDNIV
jgi:hypothetical protein